MTDIIRILRVIEYTGPRAAVERQVANSKFGQHEFGDVTMKVATVGAFPEILSSKPPIEAFALQDLEISIRTRNVIFKAIGNPSVPQLRALDDEYLIGIGVTRKGIKELREACA